MNIQPRAYRDPSDMDTMRALLAQGRKACTPTHYVHTGDLNWWLFYLDKDEEPAQKIFLWEDRNGQPLGWTLFSQRYQNFDVFLHPSGLSLGEKERIYRWAEEEMSARLHASKKDEVRTMWVGEQDAWLRAHLQARGFTCCADHMHYLLRDLDQPLHKPVLPDGWGVRHLTGIQEAEALAAVSHAAFDSQKPFDRYKENYRLFAQSPVFDPRLVWVSEAPDGRFGSFCIIWLDETNQVGHFEPVGTHPDFQCKGLGKAVMLAAMHQMREEGMRSACICAGCGNTSALQLYHTLAFTTVQRILAYQKMLILLPPKRKENDDRPKPAPVL